MDSCCSTNALVCSNCCGQAPHLWPNMYTCPNHQETQPLHCTTDLPGNRHTHRHELVLPLRRHLSQTLISAYAKEELIQGTIYSNLLNERFSASMDSTGLGSAKTDTSSLIADDSHLNDTGPVPPRPRRYAEGALYIGTEGRTSPSDNLEHAHSRSSYAEGSLVIGLKGARFVTPAPPPADSLAQLHRHAEQEIGRDRGLQRATLESQTGEDRGLGEMEVGKTVSDDLKMFTCQSSDFIPPHDYELAEIVFPRK